MATFTRAARSQECSHCFGDSSLTADYLTKVIGRNVEFERKDIAIITNFTNLYGLRIVYQGFCDVLNKSTHFFPLINELSLFKLYCGTSTKANKSAMGTMNRPLHYSASVAVAGVDFVCS